MGQNVISFIERARVLPRAAPALPRIGDGVRLYLPHGEMLGEGICTQVGCAADPEKVFACSLDGARMVSQFWAPAEDLS